MVQYIYSYKDMTNREMFMNILISLNSYYILCYIL